MRLDLNHLADHKYRHNFQDYLNPICKRGQEIEATGHFLLHFLIYRCARKTFFEKINLIDSNILQQNDSFISKTKDLLFRNEKLKDDKNNVLLTSTNESCSPRRVSDTRCLNHKQPVRLALLYKPFNGNSLEEIKEIDYCITSSIFHLHIYFYLSVDY